MALALSWMMLATNEQDGTFIPAGPWHYIGSHTQVRGWGEMVRTTGEIIARPAVQVAEWAPVRAGPRKRGAVTITSTVLTGSGAFEAGEPVEIMGAAEAAYIRVGWFVMSPSGHVVQGYVGGAIEISIPRVRRTYGTC